MATVKRIRKVRLRIDVPLAASISRSRSLAASPPSGCWMLLSAFKCSPIRRSASTIACTCGSPTDSIASLSRLSSATTGARGSLSRAAQNEASLASSERALRSSTRSPNARARPATSANSALNSGCANDRNSPTVSSAAMTSMTTATLYAVGESASVSRMPPWPGGTAPAHMVGRLAERGRHAR